MKARLSDNFVREFAPPDKLTEIHDTKQHGLVLRAWPSGKKVFYAYVHRGVKRKIGDWPKWTVEDGRLKCADLMKDPDPKPTRPKTLPRLEQFVEDEYRPWYVARHRDQRLHNLSMLLRDIGSTRLDAITAKVVDDWRTERLQAGRKPSTVNRQVHALQGVLSFAVERGLLRENPLFKQRALAVEQDHRVRYLTKDEEARLRDALKRRSNAPGGDYLTAMVLLSINTGARRGELFALTWENVAPDRLTVRAHTAKGLKTRHVPLNAEAREVLRLWRPDGEAEGLVFEGRAGEYDNVKRSWASLLREAQISDFRWHDMRHHFASRLVMAGASLNAVRELLGHADVRMTLRYAHLSPAHLQDTVNLLDG